MKILVVDDHPLIREALRQILKQLDPDISIVEADNGAAALDLAAGNVDLKLILLDLNLPGVNGFEVLERLRQSHPAIPVVVLSASDDRDTVTHALDVGAMGFIPKTSAPQVMLGALRLVFSGGVYLPAEVLTSNVARSPVATYAAGFPHEHGGVGARTPADIGLTERQAQVLALMVQGKPNKLICRELALAEGTVKIHVTACLKALNVANRTNAVIEVGRLGVKFDGIRIGPRPS